MDQGIGYDAGGQAIVLAATATLPLVRGAGPPADLGRLPEATIAAVARPAAPAEEAKGRSKEQLGTARSGLVQDLPDQSEHPDAYERVD